MKKRDGIPNKIALTILLSFGAVFLVLLFDYFNLSKYVNINVSNFNLDGISLIIGNLVVVALFLLTYFLIDARSVKKEANKRNIALVILKSTYASCKEMAIIFEDEDSRTKAAQKCDFNKVIHEDKVMMRYLNIPFEENDMVLEFTKDGILSAEEFKHTQK